MTFHPEDFGEAITNFGRIVVCSLEQEGAKRAAKRSREQSNDNDLDAHVNKKRAYIQKDFKQQ